VSGNGHKYKERKFHLNIIKNFLTVRVVENWNRLHRENREFPFLEIWTWPGETCFR